MKTFFTFLFLFIAAVSFGQFKEPKFGKIDQSELTMTRYENDTTADALLLFDNGYARLELTPDYNFQVVFDRHFRLKIFKKSAFPYAEFTVKLYSTGVSGKEQIKSVKAATYNLENGKIVQTKLEKENIYTEKEKNYTTTKFAFPQVKEGSVIELSYTVTSDFIYGFQDWTFQHSYPAAWSQYSFSIPEYFNYRQSAKGYLPFNINTRKEGNVTYNIRGEMDYSGNASERPTRENSSINARTTECVLAVKDVPAFKSEGNIDCKDNYLQSIDFELSTISFPGSPIKSYAETWQSVNEKLMDDKEFGLLLKTKGFIADSVAALCKNKKTELEKATAIYNFVQKNMKWNGNYSLWATKGLKKPLLDHSGNSAELNMLLTLMFQTAGLDADPVLFSTRDNGIALMYAPTIAKYNSVLCRLNFDNKHVLLDATSPYCPIGVIPANDVNGQGRVVNSLGGDWVDLDAKAVYKEVINYNLKLNPEGTFKGSIKEVYDGYAAVKMRNNMSREKNLDDFYRKIQENNTGLTINSHTVIDKDNISKPVIDSLDIEIGDHSEVIGNKILFQPLLYETIAQNNYKLEDRKYPVNFNYPISENYIFEYTIPEGYEVETLPAPANIQMPDKAITVSYSIKQVGNKLVLAYNRNINKTLFLPTEYQSLKEFFNQLVKKHSEKVILKKTA